MYAINYQRPEFGNWHKVVKNNIANFGECHKVIDVKYYFPRLEYRTIEEHKELMPPQKIIHLSPLPQCPVHLEVVLQDEQRKEWSVEAQKKKLLVNLKKKKKQTKFAPAYHYKSIITNF